MTDVSFEAGYHLLINRALTLFGFFRIPFWATVQGRAELTNFCKHLMSYLPWKQT